MTSARTDRYPDAVTGPAQYLSSLEIDTTTPVLVTGATGYVAGWVVKDLLDESSFDASPGSRIPDPVAKVAEPIVDSLRRHTKKE